MNYICMVVDGAYPSDIRVRKEAEALVKSDKKVLVVCPLKKGDKKIETINDVDIYRIGTNYSFSKKGIYDVIESIFDINPLFYFGLKEVFKKYSIDFLHVHDLPLAGTAYRFKSKVKYNLILYLHENYPEALKTWFEWKKSAVIRLKNTLFMNPKHWSKKEKRYCNKFDNIICVVDEMKKKLISKFNIDSNKLVVVSNHEEKIFATNFNERVAQNSIDNDTFSITYVGGFGPHRGLDTAIKAMSKISQVIPNAKLFLIGRGSADVEDKLKEIAIENKVQNLVDFVGYRPFKQVATIMQVSKLNIIPHKANEHTNNTIPHKLFQIMMSKSLLLVSSCKPLKRIVEKYDAGVVFKANDPGDFAAKVIAIYNKYNVFNYKTENAYKAVMYGHENWDAESLKLINLYNNLSA